MTVARSWRRIHDWLDAHAPALARTLAPPASEREIREAEKQVGKPFPAAFRHSLKIHNGEESMLGIFDGAQLLPLGKVLRSLRSFRDQPEELRAEPSHPIGPVKPMWISPSWVPITSSADGRYGVLDFDPAPGGMVGQVVHIDVDSPDREVVAPGFDVFLENLASALERGRVGADVGANGDVLGLVDLEALNAIRKRDARKKAAPKPRKRSASAEPSRARKSKR